MLICGVDEAGKGPVIGPMVVAGVMINEENTKKLEELGVKDSKLLSKTQREKMFESIKSISEKYKVIILEPNEIDYYVEDNRLNDLEGNKIAEIIDYLKPEKVIIDCPSPNINAFKDFIRERITTKTKLVLEHKADYKYKVVGAASILAKVIRDREIEKIKDKYKIEFGSGYPSDERTQKFLKENWNKSKFKDIFRKSWSTWRRFKENNKQSRLSKFE